MLYICPLFLTKMSLVDCVLHAGDFNHTLWGRIPLYIIASTLTSLAFILDISWGKRVFIENLYLKTEIRILTALQDFNHDF